MVQSWRNRTVPMQSHYHLESPKLDQAREAELRAAVARDERDPGPEQQNLINPLIALSVHILSHEHQPECESMVRRVLHIMEAQQKPDYPRILRTQRYM